MVNNILSLNVVQRIISGVVLVAFMLSTIYVGGVFFQFIIVIAAILAAFEWGAMVSHSKGSIKHKVWKGLGCLYIGIPAISLIWTIDQLQGREVMCWLMFTVWMSDSMAYVFGKLIGGPKIWPKISPNKTWAGFFGAIIGACVVAFFAVKYFEPEHPRILISLTLVLSVYAQLGDLTESLIKRYFRVKDSGRLIPGHGGILDRADGMIFTAPKVALVLLFFKHIF